MAKVRIPTPLRKLTDGEPQVAVEGGDLRDDGQLRRFVNVFVRDEDVRFQQGLDTEVCENDTVSIVPAVAGG